MNAPTQDIKDILEADPGLGLIFATDLFVGKEPTEPDDCVTIFDTPGFPPQLTFNKGEDYFYPSIQIRVRNRSYQNGWTLAENIRILLHGKGHETWNGTVYELIQCINGPMLLDWDENGRARFILNFNIQRHN